MRLDFSDIEKGIKQDNRQIHGRTQSERERERQREKQRSADLRLINGRHEGVQRDDNEPV